MTPIQEIKNIKANSNEQKSVVLQEYCQAILTKQLPKIRAVAETGKGEYSFVIFQWWFLRQNKPHQSVERTFKEAGKAMGFDSIDVSFKETTDYETESLMNALMVAIVLICFCVPVLIAILVFDGIVAFFAGLVGGASSLILFLPIVFALLNYYRITVTF